MSDQDIVDKYCSIKTAMEMAGYGSRTSINQKVDKGEVSYITACKNTSSEVRLFLIKDIKKIKRQREKR